MIREREDSTRETEDWPEPPHSQIPGLLGHLFKGDTTAESEVAEVQKGHAQALILKVVDLLLAG